MLGIYNKTGYRWISILAVMPILCGLMMLNGCGKSDRSAPAGEPYLTAIASSADGTRLAAISLGGNIEDNKGYIYTSIDGGLSWKKQSQAGCNMWTGIASSGDGLKLAAVNTGICNGGACTGGSIVSSIDGGSTWTVQTEISSSTNFSTSIDQAWSSIASSYDGIKLAVTSRGGGGYGPNICTSKDGGQTWVQQSVMISEGVSWVSIASSGDGTRLTAVNGGTMSDNESISSGSICTSADSGSNWTRQSGSSGHFWVSVVSSYDGIRLAAFDGGSAGFDDVRSAGNIYTSTDSGVNWTKRSINGDHYWYGLASSNDGVRLAAADGGGGTSGGYIYISADGGATWTERTGAGMRYWLSIASSADGMKIIAASAEGIITTSSDGGVTWSSRGFSGSLVSNDSSGLEIFFNGICLVRNAEWELSTETEVQNGGTMVFFMLQSGGAWVTDPSLIDNINIQKPDGSFITIRTGTPFGQIGTTMVSDGYKMWSKAEPKIQYSWIDLSQNLIAGGTYRIGITDVSGNGTTASMTFYGGGDAMHSAPLYPTNLSFDKAAKTLSWTGVAGAVSYRVLVCEGSADTSDIIYNSNRTVITGTSCIIPPAVTFQTGVTYYFQVDAHNSADGNVANANYMHKSLVYSIVY